MARSKAPPRNKNWLDVKSRRRPKTEFTARDLLHLSAAVVDGRRYELVKGRLYEMPPPGPRHGGITATIGYLLQAYARERGLGHVLAGDAGFVLQRDPDTVRGADVSFVSYQRLPPGELPEEYVEVAPDLAVEVLSPSNRPGEMHQKVEQWLGAGVRLVWVVDPRGRSVTVYRLREEAQVFSNEDVLDGEPVLPGFSCRIEELFA